MPTDQPAPQSDAPDPTAGPPLAAQVQSPPAPVSMPETPAAAPDPKKSEKGSSDKPSKAKAPDASPAPANAKEKPKSAALLEKERKKAEKAARRAASKPPPQQHPPKQQQQGQQQQGQKGQKKGQKEPQRGPIVQTIRLSSDVGAEQAPVHTPQIVKEVEVEKDEGLAGQLRDLEIGQTERMKGRYGTGIDLANRSVHPAIATLGMQLSNYVIAGSTARCMAFLLAIKRVIEDYKCPPESTLTRHLPGAYLSHQIDFLLSARLMSTAIGNAIRWLKNEISQVSPDMAEDEAKRLLASKVEDFIQEKIILADNEIMRTAFSRVVDGDVILTYSKSHVVEKTLLEAQRRGKKFRVVVADNRPLLEGKNLLHALCEGGVEAEYVHLYALDYVMPDVTKVIIGVSAILANGALYSRAGTAVVAEAAMEYGMKVTVLCETLKFSDRVIIDSMFGNELGDPEDIVNISRSRDFPQPGGLDGWRDVPNTSVVTFRYDITPADAVGVVITEHGFSQAGGGSGVTRAAGLELNPTASGAAAVAAGGIVGGSAARKSVPVY